MDKKIQTIIDSFNKTFGQDISESDLYIVDGSKVYMSTAKVADLLMVVPHQFSILYARKVRNRVKIIHQGRNKWYDLQMISRIMNTSLQTGVKFLDICKDLSIRLNK